MEINASLESFFIEMISWEMKLKFWNFLHVQNYFGHIDYKKREKNCRENF